MVSASSSVAAAWSLGDYLPCRCSPLGHVRTSSRKSTWGGCQPGPPVGRGVITLSLLVCICCSICPRRAPQSGITSGHLEQGCRAAARVTSHPCWYIPAGQLGPRWCPGRRTRLTGAQVRCRGHSGQPGREHATWLPIRGATWSLDDCPTCRLIWTMWVSWGAPARSRVGGVLSGEITPDLADVEHIQDGEIADARRHPLHQPRRGRPGPGTRLPTRSLVSAAPGPAPPPHPRRCARPPPLARVEHAGASW